LAPSPAASAFKGAIPFVVIVQSSQFDSYRPAGRCTSGARKGRGAPTIGSVHPTFTIRGIKVVLHPLEIASIPLDQLGAWAGSLIDHAQEIIAALDELITRAWE
jgi:toxin CcdB